MTEGEEWEEWSCTRRSLGEELLKRRRMEGEQEMPAVLLMEQGGKSFDQEDTKYHIVPFLTFKLYVLKVNKYRRCCSE